MSGARNSFDTIVIGSGFGGSVMTYRLSEDGENVCLLERGKAYAPGSFERSPVGLGRAIWNPSEGRHGLFDMWTFRGVDAVVSSGLGGGSLIYASVLMRKPADWFVHESLDGGYEEWPITYDELAPHYDNVEKMISVESYPHDDPRYAVSKLGAFRDAATRAQLRWEPARLGVSFSSNGHGPARGEPLAAPTYGNVHDHYGGPKTVRLTCRLCGECDIGCNYGSKNTLDHTYLSRATAKADIRTRSEVREIEFRDGRYLVRYVHHDERDENGKRKRIRDLPMMEITAKRVVHAAGALGSTYLLLRSQRAGLLPHLAVPYPQGQLGTRFSGNGDFFALALRARHPDGTPRNIEADRGPVITGAVEIPRDPTGRDQLRRGFYLEDSGYPAFVDWLAEGIGFGLPLRTMIFGLKRVARRMLGDPNSGLGGDIARLIGPATLTSTSMPLLGMGRDVPDGTMYLSGRGDRFLGVKWNRRSSRQYVEGMRAAMKRISDELGATYSDGPGWRYLRRMITVHPLGGAPMGRTSATGVVDRYGQAFGQDGLFVVDGAAMPGAVGPNPALTIAAFADWVAQAIIDGKTARDDRYAWATASSPLDRS